MDEKMKNTNRKSIRRIVIALMVMIVIVIISVLQERRNSDYTELWGNDTLYLFNGKDLDYWEKRTDPGEGQVINSEDVFFVENRNIHISGNPFGFIRTKDLFANYKLSLKWRWVSEPANSGVFIHMQNDSIWPICLECQLKHMNAGDIILFSGFETDQPKESDIQVIKAFGENSEMQAGEWNQYEIEVIGDSVSLHVNGIHKNSASGTNYTEGYIGLQSEGGAIEFKDIYIVTLNK